MLSALLALALSPSTPKAWAAKVEMLHGASRAREMEVVSGQILVRFSPEADASSRQMRVSAAGASVARDKGALGWTVVHLSSGMKIDEALAGFRRMPEVLAAEPNHIYRPLRVPNDPNVSSQYALTKVNAFSAWDYEVGTSSLVTIAVIDSGIDGAHPDLSAKLAGTIGQFFDPDANGAQSANNPPTPACSHATRVAGIAAASTDNGLGIAGISWGAQLLSLKVFNDNDCLSDCSDAGINGCITTDMAIAQAITYASTLQNSSANGKIVINMSVGAPDTPCPPILQAAVDIATAAGVVLVAAAGNDAGPINDPGNCGGVIPVGATDSSDAVAVFSSTGPELAQNGLTAPGVDMITADPGGGVTSSGVSGTSFAAPMAAGAAALLLSANPNATAAQIQSALRSTADNIGAAPNFMGAGRLNILKALGKGGVAAFTNGQNAALVLGQANFTSNTATTTQNGMKNTEGVAFDASGDLWVADTTNNRVLEFVPPFSSGMNAALVLGQANFTSGGFSTTQNGMSSPFDLIFDASGNLWVVDRGNNRVLEFTPPFSNGMNAALVLGQVNFTSGGSATTQSAVSAPDGAAFDASGNLWVVDDSNNRVLKFVPPFSNGMNASMVLGQADFTSAAPAATPSGVSDSGNVAFDSSGNLWLADYGNNRVLEFVPPFSNGMNAALVLGQANFTSATSSAAQSGMNNPDGVSVDSSGNLWVADSGNSRALEFTAPFSNGMNASAVLGQANFTSNTATTTQSGLSFPFRLVFDASGSVWVADGGSNRVLEFQGSAAPAPAHGPAASLVLGQATFLSALPAVAQSGVTNPRGSAMDSSGNLWAADNGNGRVLEFTPPFSNGMNASLVLGQANFTSSSTAITQSVIGLAGGIAFDQSGNLWVSDVGNNRVLRFSPPFSSGMNAGLVLGQANFTSRAAATSQSGMSAPEGVVVDPTGNLWVSDVGNNRVLEFSTPFSTGMNAGLILGQANFTSAVAAATQSGLSAPDGISADPSGNIWLADANNNRMLEFSPPFSNGMNASLVLGQANFTSAAIAATQSGMDFPQGVSADAAGDVWVADMFNARVLKFTRPFSNGMSASFVLGQANFTSAVTATTQTGLILPHGVFVDPLGNIWVADFAGNRVLEFPAPSALVPQPTCAPISAPVSVSAVRWSLPQPFTNSPAGYNIYQAANPAVRVASIGTTSFDYSALSTNTAYGVSFAGFNAGGQGKRSIAVTAYTLAAPPSGSRPLAVFATSATINWQPNSNPIRTTAGIDRSTDSAFAVLATTRAAGLSFTDAGLLPCTSYYYRVWNFNGDGYPTAYDGVVAFQTQAATPAAPGALAADSLPGNRISLNWTASGPEGITGYNLYYDAGTGVVPSTGTSPFAVLPPSATSFATGVLASTAAYTFHLTAKNRCGVEEPRGAYAAAASTLTLSAIRAAVASPQSGRGSLVAGGPGGSNALTVSAAVLSGTPSRVLFQYKPSSAAVWTDIGSAASFPFAVAWDITNLDFVGGSFNLRAVAFDQAGNGDTAPSAVTITVAAAGTPGAAGETNLGGVVTKTMTLDNSVSNTLVTSAAGRMTSLTIPPGALNAPHADVSVVSNPDLSAFSFPPGFDVSAGIVTKITLGPGQSLLPGATASFTLSYPDAGSQGVIDGTRLRADKVLLISNTGLPGAAWNQDIITSVDLANHTLTGITPHFSFFAAAGVAQPNLDSVRVYPVPYKPNGTDPNEGRPYTGAINTGIVFDNLPAVVTIKIYTVSGSLVTQMSSVNSGGALGWDARNDAGKNVASGGCFAVISAPGLKSIVKRLAIVR